MSTVRYFDVPHVVRYGQTDDKKGTSWMRFYRNATCFEVSIDRTDIEGTSLQQQWEQYLVPPQIGDLPGTWVNRWDDLCDCVISQILPNLQELAPTGLRSWTTLDDYLNTWTYKLSLHKSTADDNSDGVIARIDSGPVLRPAFEFKPQPLNTATLPKDLPIVQGSDLLVMNHAKDLRQQPSKMLTPDGVAVFLVPAKGSVRHMPGGQITDPSMSSITSHLSLHRLLADGEVAKDQLVCLPRVLAIVTTVQTTIEYTTDASAAVNIALPQKVFLAGVLLRYLPHARRLTEPSVLSLIGNASDHEQFRRRWYQLVMQTLEMLHTCGGTMGGKISPWTVFLSPEHDRAQQPDDIIAGSLRPHLVGLQAYSSDSRFVDPSHAASQEADWEALRNTLGDSGWLVHEIKKVRGEVADDVKWERGMI